MLHVEWYHVCWPRLTAKRVEPVVSISWASCLLNGILLQWTNWSAIFENHDTVSTSEFLLSIDLSSFRWKTIHLPLSTDSDILRYSGSKQNHGSFLMNGLSLSQKKIFIYLFIHWLILLRMTSTINTIKHEQLSVSRTARPKMNTNIFSNAKTTEVRFLLYIETEIPVTKYRNCLY